MQPTFLEEGRREGTREEGGRGVSEKLSKNLAVFPCVLISGEEKGAGVQPTFLEEGRKERGRGEWWQLTIVNGGERE